jgi:hypothetical protein
MNITVMEDGLQIYIPDEELPELYRIVNSPHYSQMASKLIDEISRLLTPQQLNELNGGVD